MRDNEIYIAFHRNDHKDAQEAWDYSALAISPSPIEGGYTQMQGALEAAYTAQKCTGIDLKAVIVDDDRKPTRYLEIEGEIEIQDFRQGEFWDDHSDFVRLFIVPTKKYEVHYDETITRRIYVEARSEDEAIRKAKDNEEDKIGDMSERVIQGFDGYKVVRELDMNQEAFDRLQIGLRRQA